MYRKSIAVSLATFLAACSFYAEAPTEDVEKAAALFYQRLNDAEYDLIHKDAAQSYKENKTREDTVGELKKMTALGKVLEYHRVSTGFEGEAEDKMLAAVYATTFESRRGSLKLLFVDESGEWKLIGFTLTARG